MLRYPVVVLGAAVMLCALAGCKRKQSGRPACMRTHDGLCLIARIAGQADDGELGFRFDVPRDVDGDGVTDVAAGARFTRLERDPSSQTGTVSVWSGATWKRLRFWEGVAADGLFGHSVVLIPDIDGDSLADLLAAAPTGRHASGAPRGVLWARSPRSGATLWKRAGEPGDAFGWDTAITGDHDGDGVTDLFTGAPGGKIGKVYLLSGRDGDIVRTYASPRRGDSFGWYISPLPDIDGDGRDDLVVGAPLARAGDREAVGEAVVLSSATGARVHEWKGQAAFAQHGEMVLGLPDIDGDGAPDVAVGAPHTQARAGALAGEVFVYSGAGGEVIHHFRGEQAHELFGRMLARAGDFDGDGVEDLAIGAPWHDPGGMEKAGRVEIRSGRTGAVLAELIGDAPGRWYGWHMAHGPKLGESKEPGLVISLVRSNEDGKVGAGALEIYVYRRSG